MQTEVLGKIVYCRGCWQHKDLSMFHKNRTKATGHSHRCMDCCKIDREKRGASYRRARHLMRNYGLTVEQYTEMQVAQGSRCKICGKRGEDFDKIGICVDHDHKTGKVRGLLCNPCNQLLGNAQDSLDILTKAMNYLRSFG